MGPATAEHYGFLKEILHAIGAKRNEQTSLRGAHNTMKIVRYEDGNGVKLGAIKGEGVVELTRPVPSLADNTIELIRQWSRLKPNLEPLVLESPPDIALADVHLLAPVARPGKVMAIGLNYADHIRRPGRRCRRIRSGSPKRLLRSMDHSIPSSCRSLQRKLITRLSWW